MKLAILSVQPELYSTRRLLESARERGHDVEVLDTTKFALDLRRGEPALRYRGREIEEPDAVLPRIGSSISQFGTAVLRQFEQIGVYCANGSHGIANSRDKLRALQLLSRHDVGIPETAYVRDRSDVLPAIRRVGGAPVVIKLLEGTQGVGVILAESESVAAAIVQAMQDAKQQVLVQKFVAESKGRDVRAFVIGDRVAAAVRRVADGQEFRSNIHLGGRAEPIELDPLYERTAVRAAQLLGLRVAGVDLLESRSGPQVMEVNSSPGLKGVESATGLDLAGEVVDFVASQVDFPELDLRQRLTVSVGYGVAELHVTPGSELDGKCLDDTLLSERDVAVLSLHRRSLVLPNPKGSERLEGGDRLLCFGKIEEMRRFVAKRTKRRPRRAQGLDGS